MVDVDDAEIDAALARGRSAAAAEPRAVSAIYDAKRDRIVVELTNGCTFAFPPRAAQGLTDASANALTGVEVLPTGYGLHWEMLDVDLSIAGLLAGLFGTSAYMARRAGSTPSPAKAAAARANGKKGGRPRRSAGG